MFTRLRITLSGSNDLPMGFSILGGLRVCFDYFVVLLGLGSLNFARTPVIAVLRRALRSQPYSSVPWAVTHYSIMENQLITSELPT